MAGEQQPGVEVPTKDQIRDFIVAAHGNLPRVREMLIKNPGLLNVRHFWSESDSERRHPGRGADRQRPGGRVPAGARAPLDVCTAAMLGRKENARRMLAEDPTRIEARGAHGIPLLPHALGNAVMHGAARMARWLLENAKPDFSWKSYEAKSLLTITRETGNKEMLELLREYGLQ